VAGDDLDSSLIVPLIKRAEPEAAGGLSPLSWPEGDTPIAGELAGELYVSCGFDLPGAFRLVSAVTACECSSMPMTCVPWPSASSPAAVPGRRSSRRPLPPYSCWTAAWNPASRWRTTHGSRPAFNCPAN
jgi:hypothetical protein